MSDVSHETDYRVVVPSYQRPAGLVNKTLTLLLERRVPKARITVYLHGHDPMLDEYRSLLDGIGVGYRVTDVRGIGAQRRQIVADHPEGTRLVTLDDDLSDLGEAVEGERRLTPIRHLGGFFQGMFDRAEAEGVNVWGLYPTANPFYMTAGQERVGLKFLMFTCVGFTNRPDHPLHAPGLPHKDDYEFSLRAWWWDGGVLRADGVAAAADYRGNPGGMDAAGRTRDEVEAATKQLLADWPGLVRMNQRRTAKTGWPEVLLSRRDRHGGQSVDTPPPGAAQEVHGG